MSNDLSSLKAEVCDCTKCHLCQSRTNTVFGVGNPDAKILFVGEAPGENEDLQGQPFVGRSGKLLDELLAEVGFSRNDNIYIANMLKCRPPKNRDPKPSEQAACLHFLEEQIEKINPKIVVCVGRIAAQKLILKDFKVTSQHGTFVEKDGRLYTATYHPAAILRNIHQKPYAQDDLKIIKEKLQ